MHLCFAKVATQHVVEVLETTARLKSATYGHFENLNDRTSRTSATVP